MDEDKDGEPQHNPVDDARHKLRKELQAEVQVHQERAGALASIVQQLTDQGLGEFAAAVRMVSGHHRIRALERESNASALDSDDQH